MSKIAVVYWSQTGHTQTMAEAVAAACGADLIAASDFDADKAAAYDAVALGCPAMGSEELEDSEFAPMYEAVKGALAGKKIGLFGSYGCGDGEWMRTWQADAEAAGLNVVSEGVIANDEPDDTALAACAALGEALK